MGRHHLPEAFVALSGWRGGHGGGHLQHLRPLPAGAELLGQLQGVGAHGLSCVHVVASDEGGVVLGVGFAVEEYHGNAFRLHARHGLGQRGRFVGRHHQQVDAAGGQRVNLAYLQVGIVAGVGYRHLRVVLIQVLGGQHLAVYLLSPGPIRALGHAYFVHSPAF